MSDYIRKRNNTQTDNVNNLDDVTLMYNLIEYSNNFSKSSRRLWQYYRYGPNNKLSDSESFKPKVKIKAKKPAVVNTKDAEITVTLKQLSNFWRNS